ncbi:MAG: oxaloacetate-decarboxylating malate dehydrogenase, partial [Vicinamibacteria bacterium]|nr:oxaloacetate-decarboxylating malate dehydrogenase [Vicinamibacteria bacterium]
MGIPVGKLALYTVAAGIHPAQTLPVSLDVGTDNADLLKDDLYLGWRHARLRGAEYETLVEEFVAAVKKCFPGALLQWEDFKKGTAFSLLERYREALPSFNDDIQGTAAVTMAAVNAAARISGIPLKEQRVVILGGGAAGIGIARLLDDTLERAGLTRIERRAACAILDSHGLLCDDVEIADIYKRDFAWPAELAARFDLGPGRPRDLASVIRTFHPHVLIGTSGQPGIFSEALVRDMAAHVERPVILPLSNPTSKTEAAPADLIAWTDGRALIATGSPFPPVTLHGKTHRIGQANNVFIFPGVGLGSLVAETSIVPEAFFAAAAEQLAHEISEADLADGVLLPRVRDLRRITAHVAEAVVRTACSLGIARPIEPSAIPLAVREAMWEPAYPHLEPI